MSVVMVPDKEEEDEKEDKEEEDKLMKEVNE